MAADPFAQQSAKLLQAFDFATEMAAKEQEHQAQVQTLLLSMLEVMDSFDRFVAGMQDVKEPTGEQAVAWLHTVRLIARQMERALSQSGLTPMACVGQMVDPQRHEIVEVKDVAEGEDDLILEVVSRGYEWQGQLLRRPQVIVARNVKEKNL